MTKNAKLIIRIARKMGAKIYNAMPERDLYYIEYKNKKLLVEKKFFINKSPLYGARTTKCKDITHYLLKKEGLKVPDSIFFYPKSFKVKELELKLKKLKYPIIIKQLQGSNSKDLFPYIKNKSEAKRIIMKEINEGKELVAQNMVFGREYRLLVLNKLIIGALEMVPPQVVGNGKDDIHTLIFEKQKKTHKKTTHDNVLKDLLKEQGYKLDSIPHKDEVIIIKRNSSLSEGGETRNITSRVHKDFNKLASEIARACGKELAGIDLMCEDIEKSYKKQKYYVIEVNGMPDLTIHYNPTLGGTEDVVKKIIEYIFKRKI